MPKPRFLGVEPNRNRHGRMRWYFRKDRKSPRVRLPDTYGSPEFEAAWRAAVAGQPLPPLPGQGLAQARRASRGKLGWLIRLYLQSAEFQASKASTNRPRRTMLEKLAEEKGTVDIEDIDRAAIQASMNARRATPFMAGAWLTTVSNMFDWATRETPEGETAPVLEENPCALVKRLKPPRSEDPDEETGHPTWSDDDLAKFEVTCPHGTRHRLIYEVLLCTGLRVGDAARVGKQHVQKDQKGRAVIKLRTEKGKGTLVTLRMLPRLKHALQLGPKGLDTELVWITGKNRRAMDKNFLGRWFSERCRAIGLDRSAHGLRKAATRRYVEAGATTAQLMAIFGWTTIAMAEKYMRMFDREKAALKAMDDFALDPDFAPTPVLGGGKAAKTLTISNG
jgi:integrase